MNSNLHIIFDENRFYVGESKDKFDAQITFVRHDEHTIEVDHTFVEVHLREHGIARKLVERVAAFARENQLKIIPTCPYAKRVLTSDPSYRDVLK